MNQISQESLDFLEEAKKAFNSGRRLSTFSNDNYIALRGGMFDDCIKIYELGNPIGNFVQILPKKKDEEWKWRELKLCVDKMKDKYKQTIYQDFVIYMIQLISDLEQKEKTYYE